MALTKSLKPFCGPFMSLMMSANPTKRGVSIGYLNGGYTARGRRLSILTVMVTCLLSFSVQAEATTYYVRDNGDNGNPGTANTPGGAWKTITHATDNVSAGDIIRVQAGNYVETATPSDSGTSGNTVTIVADGVVTTCGMNFASVNYIRVIGFTFNGSLSGCTLAAFRIGVSGTNTGLEFWNIAIVDGSDGYGVASLSTRCNACIIVGGTISEINSATNAMEIIGDDMFVGYVALSEINYLGVVASGHRSRFVNLNFEGFIQDGGPHPDFVFPMGNSFGYSNNLIESLYGIGTVTSNDNKVMHFSNGTGTDWNDNIWRGSVFYNIGSGMYSVYSGIGGTGGEINRLHFYNNTIVNCNRATPDGVRCGNFSDQQGGAVNATINNSIHSQAWGDNITSGIDVWIDSFTAVTTGDYNLADDPDGSVTFAASWLAQSFEQSNVDPGFVSFGSDFTLAEGSGARGVGGHLTNAVGAGVSSTELTVTTDTGGMFIGDNSANLPQYGGALAPGDFITVDSTTVQVASVSGDVLTLASAISWDDGDPVYFGTSSTIDIGAYPYKAGGYTITASHSSVGGTTTIAPNDASLVRFVVCYSDSVPYEIDNSSPYTCSNAAGEFSATVYPRYASTTLGVESVATTSKSGRGAVKRRGEH